MQFGSHLTIDGYGGDPVKLNDGELVTKILDELPGLVGMNKLTPAQVILAPESSAKDSGGYSGFVIIAESHISCHTFPGRHFVSIDVYTCKNEMNQEFIINYFKTAFGLQDVEVNYLKRGTQFPESDF
jgi:S-adenosylmethionine decarboxylase